MFRYNCVFDSDVPDSEYGGNTFLRNNEHLLNITASAPQDTAISMRTTVTNQFLRSMYVDIMFI
jgi:HKD family nuclease